MKKRIYKILTIFILIILLLGLHSNIFSYNAKETNQTMEKVALQKNMYNNSIRVASNSGTFGFDKIMEDADNFINAKESGDRFDQTAIKDMIKSIYNILLTLGIIAIVITGIILSIKFITGGIEEQAQVKEMLVPFVVGSVVILAAFAIWKIVVDILQAIQAT